MIPYALVLLLLVAPATIVAGAVATPSVDWAACKEGITTCFARDKCIYPGVKESLIIEYNVRNDVIKWCDVGLSVRPLTSSVWLLSIHVIPEATATLDPTKGIQIYDGDRLLLGCGLSNNTLKAQGDSTLKSDIYSTDSIMLPTGGFCSFLIKDASSLPLSSNVKIVFTMSKKVQVLTLPYYNFVVVNRLIGCNPFSLTADYSTTVNGFYKAPIPDVLKEPASCDGIPFAKLFVGAEQAMNFECKRAEKKYYFKRGTEAPETALRDNEEVFCAIAIGTTCKDLIGSSGNTPKYGQDPTTGQTSLKCDNPSHKMLINDEFYFDGAPECLSSRDSPNVGAWFARNERSLHEQIHSAKCTDQISCDVISSFNSTVPEGEFYENAYLEYGNLSCADDAFLRVNQSSDKDVLKPTLITCDFTKGIYRMNRPDQVLDQRANVYCEVVPLAAAGANLGLIVGISGGIFLLILIVVSVGLFWILIIRRRKKKKRGKVLKDVSLISSIVPKVKIGRRKKKMSLAELKLLNPKALHKQPPHVRRAYFRYLLRGTVRLPSYMDVIEAFFSDALNPTEWKVFLPFLFFLERDFFHVNQTTDHTVVERLKIIPGFCYERLRLFLLDRAGKWLDKYGYEHVTSEAESTGFIRGICFIILYKLNLMKKNEKRRIVNRVTDIFLANGNGMDQVDPSRFAIWGILHHEETGSKRCPGVHDYFGRATGQRIMFEYLWDEFNKLLKKSLEPRPVYGSKMQHVLFAMGCALEKEPMAAVWKVMKEDKRFIAQDFMWAMYGRDWLWDGAWVSMFQNLPEHHLFCDRFTQECKAYKELAEMLTRYWPDKYSLEAKYGVCFEGFMRLYDIYIFDDMLKRRYQWYERWEHKRHSNGLKLSRWLMVNDPREFHEYPTIDEPSLTSTRASSRTRDATDVSRHQSTTEATAPSRRLSKK